MTVTPRLPTLDVCCRVCQEAGDPNPPRLARFERRPDGKIDLGPSGNMNRAMRRRLYPWILPCPHLRPDGGVTWQLPPCPYGHYRPVRHERLVAAFEGFAAGQDYARLCL
jgi:hypothetical protein